MKYFLKKLGFGLCVQGTPPPPGWTSVNFWLTLPPPLLVHVVVEWPQTNIDFWTVNLPKMAIVYFINWIVAAETIQRRKVFKKGNYSRKCSMFDEKYCLTFGDLLTSFLVKNADSRWWIGKSPIGNRTTLVRGCGVDIPYVCTHEELERRREKEDHNVWNFKDSNYTKVFFIPEKNLKMY